MSAKNNEWKYGDVNGEIVIKQYNGEGGVVEIPAVIDGGAVTAIGKKAFRRLKNITEVKLPDTIKIIDDEAFSCCGGLVSIILPDGLTELGKSAFAYCKNLTEINLPDTVKIINDEAFEGCTGLVNIILPDGLKEIGKNAFRYCKKLTDIILPESLEKIGKHAFLDCNKLGTRKEKSDFLKLRSVLKKREKANFWYKACYLSGVASASQANADQHELYKAICEFFDSLKEFDKDVKSRLELDWSFIDRFIEVVRSGNTDDLALSMEMDCEAIYRSNAFLNKLNKEVALLPRYLPFVYPTDLTLDIDIPQKGK